MYSLWFSFFYFLFLFYNSTDAPGVVVSVKAEISTAAELIAITFCTNSLGACSLPLTLHLGCQRFFSYLLKVQKYSEFLGWIYQNSIYLIYFQMKRELISCEKRSQYITLSD